MSESRVDVDEFSTTMQQRNSAPGPKQATLAAEANTIINGDREATYGSPDKNISLIAKLWSDYLGKPITAYEVCDMMTLLKLSRSKHDQTKRDNPLDAIGYQLLKERIALHRGDTLE